MKCEKHPKYKAIRKPTAKCSMCHLMYSETLKNKEIEKHTKSNRESILNMPVWKKEFIEKFFEQQKIEAQVRIDLNSQH